MQRPKVQQLAGNGGRRDPVGSLAVIGNSAKPMPWWKQRETAHRPPEVAKAGALCPELFGNVVERSDARNG
jgi:hypothetical protein